MRGHAENIRDILSCINRLWIWATTGQLWKQTPWNLFEDQCQFHGNGVHAPTVDLHSLSSPWPFHTWAFDLIGPITPASKEHVWILAATECFTKWVEAIPLKKATGCSQVS